MYKEAYEELMIEIVSFKNEDVIITSCTYQSEPQTNPYCPKDKPIETPPI